MAVEEISTIPKYDIPEKVKGKNDIDGDKYQQMYQKSINDPEGFWAEIARQFVTWRSPWYRVQKWDFETAQIEWFKGGKLTFRLPPGSLLQDTFPERAFV